MVRNKLAAAILALGSLHSGVVSALGLGELELESALNQPFRAVIPLADVAGLNEDQIRVKMADDEAFANIGVERTTFLSALKFQVVLQESSPSMVIVTSDSAVVEPYLDFVVEVRWPSGKVLREYTVLLDLPVFSGERVAAPSVAKVTGTASKKFVEPETAARQSSGRGGIAVRDDAKKFDLPASNDATEYRVQHGDTMWEVAAQFNPSGAVTNEQTMLAILAKNPDAFINNNVNQIKSGYVIRLPSEREAKALSANAAAREVKAQVAAWRNGGKRKPAATKQLAPTAQMVDATRSDEQKPVAAAAEKSKFSIKSAGEDGEGGAEAAALRKKLQLEQERLDKVTLENGAMQTQVTAMEQEIETLRKLITAKNNQLAALQAGVSQQADVEPVEVAKDDVVESGEELAASEEGKAEGDAEVSATESGSEPEALAEDEPSASAAETATDASTVAEGEGAATVAPEGKAEAATTDAAAGSAWYESDQFKFIGAGVAVFLLLLMLLRRKKADSEDEELYADDVAVVPAEVEAGDEFSEPVEDAAIAASDIQEELENGNDIFSDDAPQGEDPQAGAEEEVVVPQMGDALTEADIYAAYGRYDQAAGLLTNAIAQEPGNTELRVRLCEIYLDARDEEKFKESYAALVALGDDAAVSRVKESMSAIDGVTDWIDAAEASVETVVEDTVTEQAETDADVDLALAALDEDLAELDASLEESELASSEPELAVSDVAALEDTAAGTDIEFELDLADDTAEPEVAAVDEVIADGETDELELDLDDLDFSFDDDSAEKLQDDAVVSDIDLGSGELGDDLELELEDDQSDVEALLSSADAETDDDMELDDFSFDELNVDDAPIAAAEPAVEPETAISAGSGDDELSLDDLVFDEFDATDEESGADLADFSEDEISTKLDLARAYVDMGDAEGARGIINEVLADGDDSQREEAQALLDQIS